MVSNLFFFSYIYFSVYLHLCYNFNSKDKVKIAIVIIKYQYYQYINKSIKTVLKMTELHMFEVDRVSKVNYEKNRVPKQNHPTTFHLFLHFFS